MNNMTKAAKQETFTTKGFMPNFGSINPESRRVKCSPNVSNRDKEGIIRFYEALVPRKELKQMRLKVIKQHFPTFEDIDVDMILEEAFPRFENTIGTENFAKVKKFFGIGCKISKNINSKEIEVLLSKLRSIENAQYYICGYKELVRKMANLLEGGEEYTDIEKAKIVRMYAVLFLCYIYFVEDLGYGSQINHTQLMNNNKMGFYPEELFVLFVSRFTEIPEKNIFYDSIIFEFNQIKDKKVFKELLEFSELDYKDGRFYSVNRANPLQNFALIRKIKQKIHSEPVISPIELFGILKFAKQVDFADLYTIYKGLISCELDGFKKVKKKIETFEGSRIIGNEYFCYEIASERYIAGEREKKRVIQFVEILARKDLTMRLESDLETGEELPDKKKVEYNVRQFLGAIKFVKDANLVDETTVIRDFEIANELIKRDKRRGILSKYFLDTLTIEDVKAKLKIDESFEFEFFGIKPKIDHKGVISRFAIQNGYAESKEEINSELVENVLIPGNEEFIERYNAGELDKKKFERELGLDDSEFTVMFFDISKVDVSSIEAKLLETKRSTVGKKKIDHKLKMLVLLYCYIVEGQIPCGPKNRVPKRNKALKTSILRTLI